MNPNSRSPSPVPAAPVQESPGIRAAGLINVFNTAIKSTLDKCSYNSFAACFPTTAQYKPDVLDDVRRQLTSQLEHAWKNNFESILAQRNVVQSLNSLDQYIDDARTRKKKAEVEAEGGVVEPPVPPHTLPPSQIYLAHLMPFLEEHSKQLNTQLTDTQTANTELLSTIMAQRAEIEVLVQSLESVIHDLETSAQMMGEEDVQGLSAEIRELESEMKK
ncbi:Nnf1-domain-containing protein [Delitschia confertaspora ATCC 74209]|uniref:Nnf1-domain-containing protein n=1 Tax=Delitschia confertaspora ATCC 74209 TaxID=1513339 RepID=A0A9P4JIC7_9PLEO|nr:Nnf1-domain-containing protein [Delitschia confertaspora ATCC 74209]